MPTLPFKLNADRRDYIPKQNRRVTNPAAYDASLCQRGSLPVRIADEAIEDQQTAPRMTRVGPRWYSPLAILIALILVHLEQ